MENIKPGMFYIALDGDGVGKKVGRAVIANDVDELHRVSNRIDAAQDFILHWCGDIGGTKISGGGDEAVLCVPKEALSKVEDLRKSVEKSFGYTISVGIGKSLSEAGTALLVAKLRGKDRVVYFNKKIKEDIKKAKRRVREGRATQEEYKLSEAYLEKSEDMLCNLHKSEKHSLHKSEEGKHAPQTTKGTEDPVMENPDNEDNRTDDCAYCQDLDAVENADGSAGMNDCPACAEYDSSKQDTGGIQDCDLCNEYDAENGGESDCPMCQEYDAGNGTGELENITEAQAHPEAEQGHECNCPDCPKSAGAAGDAQASVGHPDNCPECQEMYSQAVENQPGQTGQEDPNMQGHETAEEVLGLLDQEPGSGAETPSQEAGKIDNTELPQGSQMEGGTAVTENFGDAQSGNVSDSEMDASQDPNDQPDMAGVLQSGLDDHAQDQKKQQILDMVGQTLAGFKANKASLEATKEQNLPLYQSCIQMLKSMIGLCDLLGLKPSAAPAPAAPQGAPQGSPTSPTAALSEGAAQDPKTQG